VRYELKTAPYRTLEGQCLHTGTLPSLAYGGKTCSLKFKRGPTDAHVLRHFPPDELIKQDKRVVRAIGFDATEQRRTYAGVVLCGWLHNTTLVAVRRVVASGAVSGSSAACGASVRER